MRGLREAEEIVRRSQAAGPDYAEARAQALLMAVYLAIIVFCTGAFITHAWRCRRALGSG